MDDETIDSGSYDSSSSADDAASAAPEPAAEAPAVPEPVAEAPAAPEAAEPEPAVADEAEVDVEVEAIAVETDDDEGPEVVTPKAGCFGALLALAGLGAAVGYGVSLFT